MLILAALLTCLMLAVMITDVTSYLIPNWLVALLLALYPIMLYVTPERPEWKMALIIGLVTFAAGFVIFILKVMGGGDVKLLAAAGIWAGSKGYVSFIMGVAILGGGLGIVLLLARPALTYLFLKCGGRPDAIPRVLTVGQPLPYGLAIAVSFLMLLWSGQMPGVPLGNGH